MPWERECTINFNSQKVGEGTFRNINMNNRNNERQPLLGVADIRETEVKIEEYGRNVKVKKSAFSATNHFIRQSRPFFPTQNLHQYLYFSRMRWIVLFMFIANIFCFDSLYMSLVMDVINIIFLFIFLQHQFVNCCTMRYVRKQPVIEYAPAWNTFYKLSVRELQGTILTAYHDNVGVGFVSLNQGEVKFQVFNGMADMYMRHARCYSIVFFLLVVLMSGNSAYWTYARWGRWSSGEQFCIFRSNNC